MTTKELAAALLAYGENRPVTVRADEVLALGEVRVSAWSPTGEAADVEVEILVGTRTCDLYELMF